VASPLHAPYLRLKQEAKNGFGQEALSNRVLDLALTSLEYLKHDCNAVELDSHVPGKEYWSYVKKGTKALSRPVNLKHFSLDGDYLTKSWNSWVAGKGDLGSPQLLYTLATAYGVASDLFDRGNKKAPATFFEIFVAHLFARSSGIEPAKKARFPVEGKQVALTMDFLFDPGEKGLKLHLPVKMSSRERVVQAWAHHRVLEAAFGAAKYKGILVVHSETKLALKTGEVVEICVPDQWLAYQVYVARMERIYYFDVPGRYAALAKEFPNLFSIENIAEFFKKKDGLKEFLFPAPPKPAGQ